MYFISSTKSARYSAFGIHTEQVPASNQAESKQLKKTNKLTRENFGASLRLLISRFGEQSIGRTPCTRTVARLDKGTATRTGQ